MADEPAVQPRYDRVRELSTFRRFALAMWDRPRDGTIYGDYLFDVTKSLQFIEEIDKERGIRLTPAVLIARGLGLAYKTEPSFNGKVIWGTIYQKNTVDVFFQVDLGDGKDLSGTVIRSAETKKPWTIAEDLQRKAEKLRAGKDKQYEKTQKGVIGRLPPWFIRWLIAFMTFLEYNLGIPPTFMGARADAFGTLMLSNIGVFNLDYAYAPLTTVSRVPSVTLMGTVRKRPMFKDGKLQPVWSMPISGTYDHRFGDGNRIARIVNMVRIYMADPRRFEAWVDAGDELWPRCKEVIASERSEIREELARDQALWKAEASSDELPADPSQTEVAAGVEESSDKA